MAPFRNLLTNGFADAAEQSGAGITRTFPADSTLPPLLGIDHVLTYNATATDVQTVRVPGSDHLGLLATLRLTPLRVKFRVTAGSTGMPGPVVVDTVIFFR